MRHAGKWLMFFGFVIPFAIGVFLYSRVMFAEMGETANRKAVSVGFEVAEIGLPIGIVGAACWLVGVVRQANRNARSHNRPA